MNKAERLNPRFDGAFLNSKQARLEKRREALRLNPRFDGAFLN